MERISNALKCVNCRLILKSPVLFPCGHSICKHHADAETNPESMIKCLKCGRDHMIPEEGFPHIESLAEIIDTQVYAMDLGEAHKKAIRDCDNFDLFVQRVNLFLTNPLLEKYDELNGIKNVVLIKREEFKLKIDQEADKLISKLDSYLWKYNEQLKGDKFKKKLADLEEKYNLATKKLSAIKNRFNQVVFDEMWWKNTSSEIVNELRILTENLEEFNKSLVIQGDLEEIQSHAQSFQNLSFMDIQLPNINISSLKDSKIIDNVDLMCELAQVCELKSDCKWELLYRGSENKFSNVAFHAKCDDKIPTLVMIKTNDGCIFGGYTKAKWSNPIGCWKADSEAFVFSLKTSNLESRKYKVVNNEEAIYCSHLYGPNFGLDDLAFENDGKLSTNLNSNIPEQSGKSRFGVPFQVQQFTVNTQITEVEVYQELND